MIELINRTKVFKNYKKIANEITKIQNLFFDEDDITSFESKKEWLNYKRQFDAIDLDKQIKDPIYKKISFNYSDINSFTKVLSSKIQTLLKELNINQLIIIADVKLNLFGNLENDYKPLVNAYKNLFEITKTWNYEEAFKIDIESLSLLINIFFWKERCDATAPEYIFFFDNKEKLGFSICKEGNIHTIEFENEIISNQLLEKNNWYEVDGRCYDKFSDDGRITSK